MSKRLFAKFVLTDEKLSKLMQKDDYEKFIHLKRTMGEMDFALASKIAKAMKKWALSLGATHYTHWFFPLTNKSAEKQVSFLDRDTRGKVIEKFDGHCLIKGETDASSFPSGNERMTFEARGYTVWDYSSPVFIKVDSAQNKVLYIPTAFCSYNGVALDEKTPLLRATDALNKELTQFLHLIGLPDVNKVMCNLGSEQEYFLIPLELYKQRKDLVFTGRTLLSHSMIKTQEIYHHYFCNISTKINEFMHDLDNALCELGILAKVQHNEVAPAQYEIVPLFSTANISTDQNVLLMEVMEDVAKRHGFKVLLHEKPFQNINGSGKHNNWSLSTDTGINLLDKNQARPDVFMAVFSAVLSAINKHYDLVRLGAACPSNDLRLGGCEAPPSIISVYVGQNMLSVMEKYLQGCSITGHSGTILDTRSSSTAKVFKDECDRNRTSPFAFTGNKFEFRMVGSSQNTAFCNAVLCMIVANEFKELNNILLQSKDIKKDLDKWIEVNLKSSSRIVFNGNSYDPQWFEEAARRGLKNFGDSLSCYDQMMKKENIELFERLGVLTESELAVRYDSCLKAYFENIVIEARTLIDIIFGDVCKTLRDYETKLLELAKNQDKFKFNSKATLVLAKTIDSTLEHLNRSTQKLSAMLDETQAITNLHDRCEFARDKILPQLNLIRNHYDNIEHLLPSQVRPFPDYNELLFY